MEKFVLEGAFVQCGFGPAVDDEIYRTRDFKGAIFDSCRLAAVQLPRRA
jgi:hypothetical protein